MVHNTTNFELNNRLMKRYWRNYIRLSC